MRTPWLRHPSQKPLLGSQPDRSHPLARGLLGCWLFHERTGTLVADQARSRHHGTIQNPTNSTSGWKPVGSDSGWYIGPYVAGDTSHLLVTATPIPTACTYEVLLVIDTAPANAGACLTTNGAFGDSTHDRSLYTNASGQWVVYIYDGAEKYATGTTVAVAGGRYHVVATADGTTLRLYVNGREEAAAAAGYPYTGYTTPNWYVGIGRSGPGSPQGLNGSLLKAAIYDRALTAAEVAQLYTEPYVLFAAHRRHWLLAAAGVAHALASSSAGVAGLLTALRLRLGLAVVTAGVASTGAALRRLLWFLAPVTGASTVTPALTAWYRVAAAVAGTVATGAALRLQARLLASAAGQATSTGVVRLVNALWGVAGVGATVAGGLRCAVIVRSAVSGVGSVIAAAVRTVGIRAVTAGVGAVVAAVTRTVGVGAASVGAAGLAGAVRLQARLAGALVGTAAVTTTALTVASRLLATSAGRVVAVGGVRLGAALGGAVTGGVGVAASLRRLLWLTAPVGGVAATVAQLGRRVWIAGQPAGAAGLAGVLSGLAQLVGLVRGAGTTVSGLRADYRPTARSLGHASAGAVAWVLRAARPLWPRWPSGQAAPGVGVRSASTPGGTRRDSAISHLPPTRRED